jgi:hypothetical protein
MASSSARRNIASRECMTLALGLNSRDHQSDSSHVPDFVDLCVGVVHRGRRETSGLDS